MVAVVGSTEKRDARVRTLSGGQRRRLDLGLALIGDPEVVFLDEPTTGFDPEARRRAWDTIGSLRALGKTILLTTHYLEEAERLSDRVAVLRDGEFVALGPPAELTAPLPATEIRFRRNGQEVVMHTEDPTRLLHDLTEEALNAGRELEGLAGTTRQPRGRLPRADRNERRVRIFCTSSRPSSCSTRGAGSSHSSRSSCRSSSSCCWARCTAAATGSRATAHLTTS